MLRAGCGFDWAVSPLSRALTVLYLLVGAPIMYLYLTTTGALLARAIHFAALHAACCRGKGGGAAAGGARSSRRQERRKASR